MTDELMIEDDVVAPKTDFYIKLNSEADMPTALAAFYKQDYTTIVDPETGEESTQIEGDPYLVSGSADYAIDVVGVIQKATGVTLTDDEGFEYPEMAALDGWHVNLRLSGDNRRADAEALVAYTVDPAPVTPARVWL
tara:strand:+ start:961 stop:1371 length:411 start_codon:yes stop_codon:yes gene_type:complete